MTPEVTAMIHHLLRGRPLTSPPLTLVHSRIKGHAVTFCTAMENDPIQRKNRLGKFYETTDLYLLDPYFPPGGIYVDIGANIGNHALYFALILGAGRVIPIEPNPLAYRLLFQNVLVNHLLDRFDLSRLGVGVGDRHQDGFGMEERQANLGAASMQPGQGNIAIHRADQLLADITPDFIKIDTEGMELQVLAGLSGLLERCRPNIFIEVANPNEPAFLNWAKDNGYRIELVRPRYRHAKNFLIVPESPL